MLPALPRAPYSAGVDDQHGGLSALPGLRRGLEYPATARRPVRCQRIRSVGTTRTSPTVPSARTMRFASVRNSGDMIPFPTRLTPAGGHGSLDATCSDAVGASAGTTRADVPVSRNPGLLRAIAYGSRSKPIRRHPPSRLKNTATGALHAACCGRTARISTLR